MDTDHHYQTDMTDSQWAQVCHVIPAPKKGGHPARYERREITDALTYITRFVYQWRMLPGDQSP
jgi:transposase